MENNIVIDDGAKKFTFTNKLGEVFAEFSFNPTDIGIVERYEQTIEAMRNYTYDDTKKDTVEEIRKLEQFITEQLNAMFKKDISATLFSVYSPCAIFANGDLFCEIIVTQIGTIIEQEVGVRLKKKAAKIKKATAKYHK